MIDQTEDLEIRLARARLRGHQMRREAAVKWRAIATEERDRRQAEYSIADLDRQIARIIAWLAGRGATG